MVSALDVHLVGGESAALHVLLTLIGPALIAGAAVFAARVARDSATDRQQKQLEHDTQRQEEALAHDRTMREQERIHDREVRKKERARDTLDSALGSLHEARAKMNAFSARVLVAQEYRPQLEREMQEASNVSHRTALQGELKAEEADLRSASSEAFKAQMSLNGDWTRLLLRFGPSDAIPEKFKSAMDVLLEVRQDFNEGISQPLSDEDLRQAKDLSARIGARIGEFTSACRSWDAS